MDKLATEKIASEYYNLGVKHAQVKLATAFQRGFWPTLHALAGLGIGARAAGATVPSIRNYLGSKSEYLGNVFSRSDALKAANTAKAELDIYKAFFSERMPGYAEDVAKYTDDIAKFTAKAGPELTAVESLANIAPTLAVVGGVGTGAYKGLSKLDRLASR